MTPRRPLWFTRFFRKLNAASEACLGMTQVAFVPEAEAYGGLCLCLHSW
jgi:hypothetical protein